MAEHNLKIFPFFHYFFRCLHSHQLLSRLLFACQKYLKEEELVTPLGLVTRLVLGNNIFVEQFCSAVRDLKVGTDTAKNSAFIPIKATEIKKPPLITVFARLKLFYTYMYCSIDLWPLLEWSKTGF